MKEWFLNLLKSRKFWFGFVLPVVTAAAGLATGTITNEQFVNVVVASGLGLAGGIALEDGLAKRAIVTRVAGNEDHDGGE